jgi:hypothetical protein
MGTNNGAPPEYAGALSQMAEDICKTEMPQMRSADVAESGCWGAGSAFLISGLRAFSRLGGIVGLCPSNL